MTIYKYNRRMKERFSTIKHNILSKVNMFSATETVVYNFSDICWNKTLFQSLVVLITKYWLTLINKYGVRKKNIFTATPWFLSLFGMNFAPQIFIRFEWNVFRNIRIPTGCFLLSVTPHFRIFLVFQELQEILKASMIFQQRPKIVK